MNGLRRPAKRVRGFLLLLLFGLALVVRAGRALQLALVAPDTIRYIEQAQMIPVDAIKALRGEVYHPLHSIAIFLVHKVFTTLGATESRQLWVVVAQSVGVFCGALMAVLIVLLARRLGARFWPAMAAGLLWIVNRRTSAYGGDAISDMLALCLFTGSMLAAMSAMHFRTAVLTRRQVRAFLLAGLLAGLAYLTRPEGLAAPLIVMATVVVWWLMRTLAPRFRAGGPFKLIPKHRPALRPATLGLGLMLVPLTLVALPYMVIIGGVTHKKQLIPVTAAAQPLDIAASVHAPDLAAASWQIAGSDKAAGRWVLTEVCKTLGYGPMAILLLPILWHRRLWGRARLRLLVFVWAALWYAVMFWLLLSAKYLDGRHTLPLVVVGLALVAMALPLWTWPMKRWMAWWRDTPLPAWTRWPGWPRAFVATIFIATVLVSIFELRTPMWPERSVSADATNWVKSNVRQDILICDKQRLVGYYSGNPYTFLDFQPGTAVTDLVRNIKSKYARDVILVGKLYERDEKISPAVNDYQEVKRFESNQWGDVYVLYARPGDDWRTPLTAVSPEDTPRSNPVYFKQ